MYFQFPTLVRTSEPRMIGLRTQRFADPRFKLSVAESVLYLASEIHIVRAGISLGGVVCILDVLHHARVDNQIDCPDPSWPLRRHHKQEQSRDTAAAAQSRRRRHDPRI